VTDLRCEYLRNPFGIAVAQPRFGWRLAALDPATRDLSQSAFQIQVSTLPDFSEESALVWDSGIVQSDASVQRVYGGAELAPRTRYYWRVQVWDNQKTGSGWSDANGESAWWEMALAPEGWRAEWIAPVQPDDANISNPAPYLRRDFTLNKEIVSARIYATAQGLYELSVNGKRFNDELFRPGWTSYHHRIQYQTWDVTSTLRSGENALGVVLGDGWYRGSLGWGEGRNVYGRELALLLQLHVRFADGSEEVIASSTEGWKASTGAIRISDLYHGEEYDARLEPEGWSEPGFDDRDWSNVRAVTANVGELVAQYGPSVTRQEVLTAKEITTAPDGEIILDLGQNMVGWARLRVQGRAGDQVRLRFAEVLNPDGSMYVANLRTARATDLYTLSGEGEEVWEPRFTYHGFRYIGVSGYPGEVTSESVVGVVLHSEMDATGSFACSNPLINQLQSNIQWGQKGNFLEVPTDCPQRDERMGWTGDAQVFAATALFNRDAAAFYTRWLRDLAADQTHDGAVPHVVPDVLHGGGAAAWGDAAAIVPWNIYLAQGDTRVLEEQYDSIVAWVEYIRSRAGDSLIWNGGSLGGFKSGGDLQFGDWVAVEAQDEKFPHPVTSYAYLCTAFFAYSTALLVKIARILGREEDALYYGALEPRIRQAIADEFITPGGRIDGNTQTDYVLALHFDLLPVEVRAAAARRLADEVRRFDNHLSTGFVGTPYLCHVLARFGYLDLAYAVLETETWPGWLYTVTRGATTMWERWDSIRPNGEFGNVSMNSFNHYAYGAIGDWLYQVVAGLNIDPMTPAYKRAIIAPQPGGALNWARAAHESPYGLLESAWRLEDGSFTLEVAIPPNSEGVVRLPAQAIRDVTESGIPLSDAEGVRSVQLHEGNVEVTIGSGRYHFAVHRG